MSGRLQMATKWGFCNEKTMKTYSLLSLISLCTAPRFQPSWQRTSTFMPDVYVLMLLGAAM
jgi:hypothetical protein